MTKEFDTPTGSGTSVMHRLRKPIRWLVFGAVLPLAVILVVSFWLPSYIEKHPQWVADKLSESLGQQVTMQGIDGRWDGAALVVELHKVTLVDPLTKTPGLAFDEIGGRVSVIQSLFAADLVFETLIIRGTSLSVIRTKNRSLRIAGAQLENNANSSGFPAWLFTVPSIELRDTRIYYTDQRHLADFDGIEFRQGRLSLSNPSGQHHVVKGSLRLPDELGSLVSINADIVGDLAANDWSGEVHVKSDRLHLEQWLKHLRIAGAVVHSGKVGVDLKSRWLGGRFQTAQLDLSVTGFALKDPQSDAPVAASIGAQGKLLIDLNEGNWHLRSEDFQLHGPAGPWLVEGPAEGPSRGLRIDVSRSGDDGPVVAVKAEIPSLNVADVWPMILASPDLGAEQRSMLLGIQPRANLLGIQLAWQAEDGAKKSWEIRSRFTGLDIEAWRDIPSLQGLAGEFSVREGVVNIGLDSTNALIHLPTLFDDAFPVGELKGRLNITHAENTWEIHGKEFRINNEHIKMQGGFVYRAAQDQAGELLLRFDFSEGKANNIGLYLPSKIFQASTTALLDPLIVNGTVPSGFVSFRGRFDDFPFASPAEGEFRVEFDAQDVELDYAPGWPHITGARGHVTFLNQGMTVKAETGHLWGSHLKDVVMSIANLDQGALTLEGRATGPASDMLRIINETGIKEAVGESVQEIKMRGDVELQLALAFPVDDGDPEVKGNIEFLSNDLLLPKRGIALHRLSGNMQIRNDGVKADGISARFRNRPVKIKMGTHDASNTTQIELRGQFGLQDFLDDKGSPIAALAEGRSDWHLRLRLPASDKPGGIPRVRLRSSLASTHIKLPRPLAKARGETLPFQLDTALVTSRDSRIQFSLGKRLKGKVTLSTRKNAAPSLKRLALGIFTEPPKLSQKGALAQRAEIGVKVRGPFLELGAWLNLVQTLLPKEESAGADFATIIDIDVLRASAFGRFINRPKIRLEQNAARDWNLQVDSQEIQGTVKIPQQPSASAPVIAYLDHLYLAESRPGRTYESTDPAQLPALRLIVDDFRYGDLSLGRLELDTSPVPLGLKVRQLDVKNSAYVIKGWGEWLNEKANKLSASASTSVAQRSRFDLTLSSADLASTLESFDVAKAIESKKVKAHLRARWNGGPAEMELDKLDGELSFELGNGRILDIDPGAGKVLGLLSLTALPRRLRGDFGQVFDKGFVFSEIKGNFSLREGVATTSDLIMRGPAANITVNGSVGLADHSYDQEVTVTPQISSTLPLAGILAGGVGAGVVMLIAEKVLEKPINQIASYKYTIKGSWDKPQIEPVTEQEKSPNEQDDSDSQDGILENN